MTGQSVAPPRRRSRPRQPSSRWAHCGIWGRPRSRRSRRSLERDPGIEVTVGELAPWRRDPPRGATPPQLPRVWGRRAWQLLALVAAIATLVVVPAWDDQRLLAVGGYLMTVVWLQFGTRPWHPRDGE